MDPLSLACEAAPKALVYAAVMLAVGICAARQLASMFGGASVDAAGLETRLSRLAPRAGLILLFALSMRAVGHTVAAFGPADGLAWASLRTVAWESQWGQGWQWQVGGALTFAVCALSIAQWGRLGWSLTDVAAIALCYSLPATGHASGEWPRIALHGTHVLGAGLWLGAFGATFWVTTSDPRASGSRVPEPGPDDRLAMLAAFAPLALTGIVAIVLTGFLAAWLYVGSADALVSTTYGRTLLVKVVLVLDAMTFGFLNWRGLHRPASGERARLRWTLLSAELVTAAAIVVVTAVLTELEHP